ncbi:MAG: tetratricopeptide repeat protein [Gammaproteobacteria bacterium]
MMESHYIYEGTEENFATLVLNNSNKGPVLVNFWAEWAGPCHRLFPLLAQLAREYAGKFLLVNFNIDEQAPVAQEYGVKSLPVVKIFRGGKLREEVHGYQPEAELRRIINRYVVRASDERIGAAIRLYQKGDVDESLILLAQAALDDPENLRIPVILGKLLVAQRRYDEAEALLRGLPPETREQGEISHLLAHLSFIQVAQRASDRDALATRLAADPGDSQIRYEFAALAVVNDDYETALENLLELVRRDRTFGEDAGRRGMLALFDVLKNRTDLVERYRARMFSILH